MPCYIILFYSISSPPTLTVAFEFEFVDWTSFGSHIWFYKFKCYTVKSVNPNLDNDIEYEYSMPCDMWILSLCVCLYASLALPPFQNISFVSILNLFQNCDELRSSPYIKINGECHLERDTHKKVVGPTIECVPLSLIIYLYLSKCNKLRKT